MYKNNLKSLYIGKSKLTFDCCSDTEIGQISKETKFDNPYMPDLYIPGVLNQWPISFNTNVSIPEHIMYITGIPKDVKSLDPFRLKGSIWSSYCQDEYRGYLFQILRISQNILLKEI